MSGEKTEQPSHKKLQDARRKGEIPRSQDLGVLASLATAWACLGLAATFSLDHLRALLTELLRESSRSSSAADIVPLAWSAVRHGVLATLPFVLAAVAAAVLTGLLQTGFSVSFEPLKPRFDRVNPVAGLKRLFSVRSVVDLVAMLIKALALSALLVLAWTELLPLFGASTLLRPTAIAQIAWDSVGTLVLQAVLLWALVAPVDLGLQRWLFRRDQRMSKDDQRREYKEMEGDPMLKGARQQQARADAMSPVGQRMQGADAVVTNPTHYAVALCYRPGVTPLPVVLAGGCDEQAAEIRHWAGRLGIPVLANPPLARALWQVPPLQAVPEHLLEVVAAVIRWTRELQALRAQAAGAGGSP